MVFFFSSLCHIAFEKSEERRLEAEMAAFAKELDLETQQETEKQEKNIEALARRKEELIQENKQKLKVKSGICDIRTYTSRICK